MNTYGPTYPVDLVLDGCVPFKISRDEEDVANDAIMDLTHELALDLSADNLEALQTAMMIGFIVARRRSSTVQAVQHLTDPFKFTIWYKPENEDEPWLIVNENDDSFSFWPTLEQAQFAIDAEAAAIVVN